MLSSEAARRRASVARSPPGPAETIAYFSRCPRGARNVKGIAMKKIAMSALMVGALGLASAASTSPAEAHWRGGWGPGIAGGLIAGAVIGGLASSAYGWGPGYGYYGGPGYYGPHVYDYGYDEPYR
jgi:hypothetical protein